MPFDDLLAIVYPDPPNQYLRKWTLSVGQFQTIGHTLGAGGSYTPQTAPSGGLWVLSTNETGHDLRMTFQVRQADSHTPNTAIIRVYNLRKDTAQAIIQEFNTVQLQAGYINGNYGTMFSGTIKQYNRGRESAVDTYLEIYAADGDIATNCATINQTLAAESTNRQRYDAAHKSMQAAEPGLEIGGISDCGGAMGGTLPRDRVLYGMTMAEIRDLARTTKSNWSIQNRKIQVYGQTEAGPATGQVVVLNAHSGLIGMPEATQEGIEVTCLLNPAIRVGSLIKLDNEVINQYFLPGGQPMQGLNWPSYDSTLQFYASTSNDGLYRVFVIDYEGDNRGLPWYNKMVCLAVDQTADQCNAVAAGVTVPTCQVGDATGTPASGGSGPGGHRRWSRWAY
jgi:hypothetical protein